MFAEIVVNIEAPLQGTFHYSVPRDLTGRLKIGHLVEIEFGKRLAQGIVVQIAPQIELELEEIKPIINIIDPQPVVTPWQISAAGWLSQAYLTPLNSSLRLFLPIGTTRWADVTLDLNPYWDGEGRLTELQEEIINHLKNYRDLRGKQLQKLLDKKHKKQWQTAVNQLAKREIIRKATVLDPPRLKPKKLRTAELIARPQEILTASQQLGRSSKQADILYFLAISDDPLPTAQTILTATGASEKHLHSLVEAGLVQEIRAQEVEVNRPAGSDTETTKLTLPTSYGLAIPHKQLRPHLFELRNATIYHHLLTHLAQEGQPVNLSDLYSQHKANLSHLKKLAELHLIQFGDYEVWRDPLADRDFVPAEPPLLTADQARVWGRVKVAMLQAWEAEQPAKPIVLHGVTGSGKTEIYMRAIEMAIENEQQAIVLVPEIALTPQTVRRFAARFPGRVAILHSRLTEGERYDTWRRARQGLFDIIVGPRSALFTPFPKLGVIIVDEEHDHSYKQTPPVPPPYYHARDLAIELGRLTQAMVILGSATPDLVTYHRAQAGLYQMLELPRRVMGHRLRIASQESRLQVMSQYLQSSDDPDEALTIPLPPIQVVDLRHELRAGNRSIFSRPLQTALDETLERGEQAILFLNRRGSASFVICRDCGHTMNCPRCDLPLTFHRNGQLLVCHQCGYKEQQPTNCPQCGSKRIKYFGLGTEELQEQVQQRWPQARLTRWDRDTTSGRDSHETLLASFINHESDVLVGTQMIAKGLDLPLVTLVGVISADVSLGLPDYHTGERTFQLLAQVAGRAGRGLLGGRVIIQTYQPEHYAIQAAAGHDYNAFYLDEIRFRTQHGLPPFRRLARLEFVDPSEAAGYKEAHKLAKALQWHIHEKALSSTEVLGPHPPFFSRIDQRYRWQIIVRSPDPLRLLTDFPIPGRWVVDIDPVSTL